MTMVVKDVTVELESGNVAVVMQDGATIAAMESLLVALRGLGVPEGAKLQGFQIWDAQPAGAVRVSLSWRCEK